jgi:glutathione synthase/RimK-type ligase-like ATP-grasp enzyme
MPAVLGAQAMRALKAMQATLGLDYAGIDFGLSDDGDLLLFEANATMVIAKPNDDARWAYRRGAIDRVLEAVVAMLRRKATTPERHRR